MLPRRDHILLSLLLLAAAGCLGEAQHSNPFDPLSGDFRDEGTLAGSTTRFYPPHSPVQNAEVVLEPGPHLAESDGGGRFTFRNVPSGRYRIFARKEGFVSDVDTVTIAVGSANTAVDLRLDGLPAIQSFELRTLHIDRWWPGELYQLDVLAEVEDPDGLSDVATVEFEIPALGYRHTLAETGIAGRYQVILPADSLPGGNLHAMAGRDFLLRVRDDAGFETTSLPRLISRIIDSTPIAVEPQAQETVEDSRPRLVWEDAALPFEYSYRIDVVLDQANVQNVVKTVTGISADSTSYRLETPLAPGTYFWTVSVVDAFGNRSRSKEAGFIVP